MVLQPRTVKQQLQQSPPPIVVNSALDVSYILLLQDHAVDRDVMASVRGERPPVLHKINVTLRSAIICDINVTFSTLLALAATADVTEGWLSFTSWMSFMWFRRSFIFLHPSR